jgi:CxxC-x17-CxxC domain-containing protein
MSQEGLGAMLGTDSILVCASCGTEFNFPAAEQEFYQQKGFAPPKRCKPCREAAKAQRGAGGSGGGFGGPRPGGFDRPARPMGDRPPRELHDATCASCGVQTQVPFKPSGERPVYCRDCFKR